MSLFKQFSTLLKQDWYRGIFCVCIGFLLPEYCAVIALIPALIYMIRCIKREGLQPRIGRLGVCLTIYIATMYISIFFSLHPFHSLLMSLLWTILIIGYFLVTTVLTDRDRIRITLQTLAAVLAICGVVSLLQYVLHGLCGLKWVSFQFWEAPDKFLFSYFPIEMVLDWAGARTAAVFNNPNLYGQFAVMLLPMSVYCAVSATEKITRRTFLVLSAISLVGVLFTFSRGSYLALILTTLVFLVLLFTHSKFARHALVGVAAIAVLFILIPNPFMDRLASISPDDLTVTARLRTWEAALAAIRERPIFGYGAGTLNAMDIIQTAGIKSTPHTHNAVLELLVEGGIFALLPFLAICWHFLSSNIKVSRKSNQSDTLLSIALLAMFCGFVLNLMVDYPFHSPKLSLVFMLILGLSDVHFDLCEVSPLTVKKKVVK